MPLYRLYSISKRGHVLGPPAEQKASNDADAVMKAHQFLNGHDIEIWQEARLVAYLVPDKKWSGL
jgi:hypothetical protein